MKKKKLTIEEMYQEFERLIYFESWKHLKSLEDPGLVEDCAQEVMAKMYQEYDKLAALDYNALAAYIGKMAFGTAVNCFNKETRIRNNVIPFESFDEQQEERYAMADVVINSEVRESIAKLSASEREIIELFCFLKYSHAEIARILCISEDNSRQRLRRAKISLRRQIEIDRKKYNEI